MPLSFDEWVDWVFAHEPSRRGGFVDAPDYSLWDDESDVNLTAEYVTRLFESADLLLDRFTYAQIAAGVYFLASTGGSAHLLAFVSESVPLAMRLRGVRSIYRLYERLFAPADLQRTAANDSDELSNICFMFWDVCPIYAGRYDSPTDPGHLAMTAAILETLEKTLALPSLACQEAALHGLGHQVEPHTHGEVERIIDAYLKRDRAPDRLREYARNARAGRVQ